MAEQNTLNVTILDRDYLVACPQGAEQKLTEAATTLNAKMREIRDTGRVFGIERIAVMAALNLTHELLQTKPDSQMDLSVIDRLNNKLDGILPANNQDSLTLDFDD